ncbi:hypothetical protein SK128_020527, partial [Halocaridina rubra]
NGYIRRKKGDETWGPWGISSAYTSASLSIRRLLAQRTQQPENGEGAEPQKDSSDVATPLKNFSPLLVDAVREKKKSDSNGVPEGASGERSHAFFNVSGGSPLSHTHVLSQAHPEVGTDERNGVSQELQEEVKSVSGDASNLLNFFRGSASHSKVKKNEKITATGATVEKDLAEKKSNGSKIVQGDSPLAGGVSEIGVKRPAPLSITAQVSVGNLDQPTLSGKVDSFKDISQDLSRPFFYLPSDEEDSVATLDEVDRELLKDPDLYPSPVTR